MTAQDQKPEVPATESPHGGSTKAPDAPPADDPIAAALEAGDNRLAGKLAHAVLANAEASSEAKSYAGSVLTSLRPEKLALIFFVVALTLWSIAFTLGVVLRHG